MKIFEISMFLLLIVCKPILSPLEQCTNKSFNQLYNLIKQKNYFKAKETYVLKQKDLNFTYQKFIEAILDNAFNKLEASNKKINQLIEKKSLMPDSLMLQLYKTKENNSVKLFEYREAKNALITILNKYRSLLSEQESNNIKNDLKIWSVLENEPKQHVVIRQNNCLKMEKDKGGLNTLKITSANDTINFVFDTGANLSTVSETTAQRFNMKIIPSIIKVGTITGEDVIAKVAICPSLKLGNIEIQNAVFLVLADTALTFSEINYQIFGIIGFPIINALREIQITKENYFIVPKEETQIVNKPNMAISELTPLIYIDNRHYSFDTGADLTILYRPYYIEKKNEIDSIYKPTKLSISGAGGVKKEFAGYIVTQDFKIIDKKITLNNIRLLKEEIDQCETVYGNIGNDLITKFDKMTLNFAQMFIKFD